jgi:hypothetical protein
MSIQSPTVRCAARIGDESGRHDVPEPKRENGMPSGATTDGMFIPAICDMSC